MRKSLGEVATIASPAAAGNPGSAENLLTAAAFNPPPLCALGWLVVRAVIEQGQERMDEEGCGAVYAALRWPSNIDLDASK
jgi:hypothetical protein